MGTYHQLTEYQRYQIYALKKAGHDQQRIAVTVSVSPSTICRELQRNQGQRGRRREHQWADSPVRAQRHGPRYAVASAGTPHHGSAQSSAAKGIGISNTIRDLIQGNRRAT